MNALRLIITVLFLCVASASYASNASRDLQALKQDVLQLNKELKSLEKELLYPSTQAAFFLSLDVGTPIRLVDVNLILDDQHIGYHFYEEQEFEALSKGAVHRLDDRNITSGKHILKAIITGYDPQGKDYQKTAHYEFVKNSGKKFIELHIVDSDDGAAHRFAFKEWEE